MRQIFGSFALSEGNLCAGERQKGIRQIRLGGALLFLIYLVVLIYFLFFADEYGRIPGGERGINLMPFLEIRRFLGNFRFLGWKAVFLNVAGNILAFVPLGAILPVLFKTFQKFSCAVLGTALFSAAVEGVQYLTGRGRCDVDDIILNVCGGIFGYLLFRLGVFAWRAGENTRMKKAA